MEISVTCSSLALAKDLDLLNVDNIIIGIKNFSCRFNNYFSIEDVEHLSNELKNSQLTICLNSFYFEEDLKELTEILFKLSKIKINKIMFSDFAIPQIIFENNLNFNLQYAPETLVTSYGQFDFYLKNNIKSVVIATELTWLELNKIIENKSDMKIAIKAHGLGFVMYSRWPMISNYRDDNNFLKDEFNNIDYLLIKEEKRLLPNLIYEDDKGTHMMTGYYICSIKKILEMKQKGMDEIIIDSLFIEDNNLKEIIDYYINCLNLKYDAISLNQIWTRIKSISKFPISEGFFGETKDVLHTLEVDNHDN